MSGRLISVVVPIYFEEDLLDELHRRLIEALDRLTPRYRYEIIFVDDGSTDRSLEMLRDYAEHDSRIRVLAFSRNFGHQIAITAGTDAAKGDAVVVIDGDLQDPPEVIEQMVEKWEEGYEVVYGQRGERVGESAFKRKTATLFYRLINRLSDFDLPLDTGDFRLMDRVVVDQLIAMREENRYIRGMVTWVGFRQYALQYRRDARYAGQTKYTFRKMIKLALDGVTSFSSKPLILSTYVGLLTAFVGFLYLGWIVLARILNPDSALPGYASLTVIILFLGGVQLISIGVMGSYIGRIFYESKGRPLYIVAREFGSDDSDPGT